MSECHMNIPNEAEWAECSLDQICTVISRGTAPVYVEHSDILAIGQRCVSCSGFDVDKARPHSSRAMRNVLVPECNDVLLNSTGTGTIGRSCVFRYPGNFIVDGHITVLRSREGKFKGEWLDSVLKTWWGQNHLERFCFSGSTNQVELSSSQLAAIFLPVPAYPEQEEIASILDKFDTTIRQTEAIIAKLQQVKQGLLHDLLTRGIDPNGELRPPVEVATQLYKNSPLGWIPKAWEVVKVANLLANLGQGWSPDCPAEPAQADKWGVLKTTSVVWSGYDDKENKALPSKLKPRPDLEVQVGDILITRAGPKQRVGVVAYVAHTRPKLMISDKIYRLRLLSSEVPPYIALALTSRYAQAAISRTVSGMAESQTNISQAIINGLDVLRPSQEEQAMIVSQVSAIDMRLNLENVKLEKFRQQKLALKDDLLTGRVRVTSLLAQLETNT